MSGQMPKLQTYVVSSSNIKIILLKKILLCLWHNGSYFKNYPHIWSMKICFKSR
jgi:hypothetical protein